MKCNIFLTVASVLIAALIDMVFMQQIQLSIWFGFYAVGLESLLYLL